MLTNIYIKKKAYAAYFSFMPRPVYQSQPIAANSPKPVQAEWYKFTRKKETREFV